MDYSVVVDCTEYVRYLNLTLFTVGWDAVLGRERHWVFKYFLEDSFSLDMRLIHVDLAGVSARLPRPTMAVHMDRVGWL